MVQRSMGMHLDWEGELFGRLGNTAEPGDGMSKKMITVGLLQNRHLLRRLALKSVFKYRSKDSRRFSRNDVLGLLGSKEETPISEANGFITSPGGNDSKRSLSKTDTAYAFNGTKSEYRR